MPRSLILQESDGKVTSAIEEIDQEFFPARDVTVRVDYSTLNYKDGMVIAGLGRLVRSYPHIPGVDLGGEVISSNVAEFNVGDKVIATGFRIGELYFGGFSTYATLSKDWIVPLPKGLTVKQAMAIGTAGLTSMLGLMALERHGLHPGDGEVLVTGAMGGVGSTAVALLNECGYQVTASSGRPEGEAYLRSLGATTIIAREDLSGGAKKPLDSERWAGCIDAVGGPTLAAVLSQTRSNCAVAAVGLAGGSAFEGNVLPFLLRGIALYGVDSVMAKLDQRVVAWDRLSQLLPKDLLDSMTTECSLSEVPSLAKAILRGEVRGRVVINTQI